MSAIHEALAHQRKYSHQEGCQCKLCPLLRRAVREYDELQQEDQLVEEIRIVPTSGPWVVGSIAVAETQRVRVVAIGTTSEGEHFAAVELCPEPLKVYATRLENAAAHQVVAQALAGDGHELTYDWTKHGSVLGEVQEVIERTALNEYEGITSADVLVALLPGGRGTHTEIGIALGAGVPVVLVGDGDDLKSCVFYFHPGIVEKVYGVVVTDEIHDIATPQILAVLASLKPLDRSQRDSDILTVKYREMDDG